MKNFSTFLLIKTKLLHFSCWLLLSARALIPHFFPLQPFSCLSGQERLRQRVPAYAPVSSNLMGSGRGEQAEIWKWRSFLRKSGFPHETTQGTDSAREPAAKNNTCGVFGLISDKGWYKGRINVGLEGRRSNASTPVGALVHFIEILCHVSVCDGQPEKFQDFKPCQLLSSHLQS